MVRLTSATLEMLPGSAFITDTRTGRDHERPYYSATDVTVTADWLNEREQGYPERIPSKNLTG